MDVRLDHMQRKTDFHGGLPQAPLDHVDKTRVARVTVEQIETAHERHPRSYERRQLSGKNGPFPPSGGPTQSREPVSACDRGRAGRLPRRVRRLLCRG